MCIIPSRRPTKRVSSVSWAEYHGISQPMKSRYRALSSYGPWQKTAKVTLREWNIGQLANLGRNPGAPLALLRRRVSGVPHEIVGDEHPTSLKCVQQCHFPTLANKRCGTIHLDHGQPSASSSNRVAFSRVSFLSNPQCIQLRLENTSSDHIGRSEFISHEVAHCSLRYPPRSDS